MHGTITYYTRRKKNLPVTFYTFWSSEKSYAFSFYCSTENKKVFYIINLNFMRQKQKHSVNEILLKLRNTALAGVS